MGKEKRTSKEVSLMVGGGALLLNVLAKLVRALSVKGVSAEEIRALDTPAGEGTLDRVAGWMVAGMRASEDSCAPPSDWWDLVLLVLLSLCNFDKDTPHSGLSKLNGKNFPYRHGDLESKEVKLISIRCEFERVAPTRIGSDGLYEHEVRAYLAREGFRPATLVELLLWWIANYAGVIRADVDSSVTLVALGSESHGGGYPCVHFHVFDNKPFMPKVFRQFFISKPASGMWPEDRKFAAVKINDKEVS